MSVHGTRIWVLITDGLSSRLCSCHDGTTTPITTPLFGLGKTAFDSRDLSAYKAWFKAEPQKRLSQNPRRQHVAHLCQLLLEGARERAYDGIVVVATPPIAAELEEALAPSVRALLIGKIIREAACPEREVPDKPREVRH